MKRTRKLLSICLSLCIFFTCMVGIKVPTAAAAETTPASTTTDDPVIIVSLGDSYSSGEGIEPFIGQQENGVDRDIADRVQSLDWLAHRSTKAWSGMLTYDKWYFAAASGAKIEHLTKEQKKTYNLKTTTGEDLKGDVTLTPQLKIIENNNLNLTENDFVTITIGGNDVGFVDILTTAFVEELIKDENFGNIVAQKFPEISSGNQTLDKLLNEKTSDEYKNNIKEKLKNAYLEIKEVAEKATILVAGYPSLLYDNDSFTASIQYPIMGTYIQISVGFPAEKAHRINEAVSLFNTWIKEVVDDCAKNENMNIYFVSVDEKEYFKGKGAYSGNDALINGIILTQSGDQNIDSSSIISSSSFHPNEKGAAAYAEAVKAKITEIEEARSKSFSALQKLINDTQDDEIILDKDYTALPNEGPITIGREKSVMINLNGHTIDRHLTSAKQNGNVIYNEGKLIVLDRGTGGKITGGFTNENGGGIYNRGILVIESGTISGNIANELGGGVYNNGEFYMKGGTITGNTAYKNGGGVYSYDYKFIIDNGSIINISGNKDSQNSNNACIDSEIIVVNDTPVSGSKIGITTEAAPNVSAPVTITSDCKDDISYLVSDNSEYVVVKDGTAAKLAVQVKVTFNKNHNDNSETMADQILYGGIETVLNSNTFKRDYYTFSGWATESDGSGTSYNDGEKITITENTILYAQWTANEYSVVFVNENGEVLQSSKIKYGETPVYSEPTPTITPNAQYTYTFEKWSPDIEKVKGDATYTATYTKTINKYTIKFVNEDGTALQSSEVNYGETPVYNGEKPAKAPDTQYTYTFDKWDSDIVAVVEDATYKATYSKTTNKYKITFVNEDGTVLQSSDIAYDETPVYNGEKPTKAPDEQYTYTFDKWSPVIAKVAGNATYTATYTKTINKYKITFVNEDGTVLQSSEVEYGETPKYLGETPVKAPNDKYNYIFAKWDSDIVKVTGDATYTATFKQSTCRHTSVEKKVENKKEPTCTEEGSYDEVTYCELCKEELSRKTITEDPTGHKWGDWEVVKKPTVTEKGTEQRVCANDPTHIETREIEKLPKMVYKSSFETVTWQKGSGKALTWTIHRAEDDKNCILHYWYTLLNGKKIPVDAKSGSTIITISAEILEKLSAGTHTITVVFDDGEVTLPLLISAATPNPDASPTTGDNSNPALWYLLTFCSLAGLALFTRYGRKRAEE